MAATSSCACPCRPRLSATPVGPSSDLTSLKGCQNEYKVFNSCLQTEKNRLASKEQQLRELVYDVQKVPEKEVAEVVRQKVGLSN